jgi:hypothetical protein
MTTLNRHADKPGPLAPNPEDHVSRSAVIVQAAGYRLIPLAHPIGPWQILATCPRGLLLVAVVDEAWPALGVRYGAPPSFPMVTRRLLHHWMPERPLPTALAQ